MAAQATNLTSRFQLRVCKSFKFPLNLKRSYVVVLFFQHTTEHV